MATASIQAAADLDWTDEEGFRSVPLAISSSGPSGFESLPPDRTGIRFQNQLELEHGLTNQALFSGSGVAAGDVDGDGWCDLYFCHLDGPNALYRNLGNWRFQAMPNAGVACPNQNSTGATLVDVDGDHDLDLLVSALGPGVRLFLNDGQGSFEETTRQAGLHVQAGSMSMALADIDGDGDLDLYVTNYRTETLQDQPGTRFRIRRVNGIPTIIAINDQPVSPRDTAQRYFVNPQTMQVLEHGEPDNLFLNDGRGTFTRVDWSEGRFRDTQGNIAPLPLDWGLSVMFRDLNQDGAPDLYVCNDTYTEDRIWLNDGTGQFQAMDSLAVRKTSFSSMGIDVADINRDGWDDLFICDMLSYDHTVKHTQLVDRHPTPPPGENLDRRSYFQNTLLLNRGDGSYAEIAFLAGLEASDWSWMPLFIDVDLDGYEDLLIGTGLTKSYRDSDARRKMKQMQAIASVNLDMLKEQRRQLPPLFTPNYAFHNRGNLTFERVSDSWGFDSRQVSHGMTLADLDNDGDQDVVINCLNAPALVYRNNASQPRVAVRLRGRFANTSGIGASIRVFNPESEILPEQKQEIISGGRYLSSDQSVRMFAAGSTNSPVRIEVRWREGGRSVIPEARPNHLYEILQPPARGESPEKFMTKASSEKSIFQDVSHLVQTSHDASGPPDFTSQPMLSRQLHRTGPGLVWFDINGDGWEDLVMGNGQGSEMALLINNRGSAFQQVRAGTMTGTNQADQAAVLMWSPQPGTSSFLMALSHDEKGDTNVPSLKRYDLDAQGSELKQAISGQAPTIGPLVLADLDGDSDLDLFMGGRIVPGRYPEAASSFLCLQDDNEFTMDATRHPALRDVGPVNSAVASDLTGDGLPELILACEWGPLKVFGFEKGQLRELTGQMGLDPFKGWWQGVTAGDLNGDGRMDLVASNWGRNSRYQRYIAKPLRIYFDDLYQDGTVEIVEAHFERPLNKYVPWRHLDFLSRYMPVVQQQFSSFQAFSQAGVEEIAGVRSMRKLQVNTLDSTVFLNRGGTFEARSLPVEAQFAPAFGVNVGDADGDGNEDIFLAQNFFGVDSETPRYDAGLGLWLKGDGRGNFKAWSALGSGIRIHGEQRGSALADYNRDGRIDLAVAQHGGPLKLFQNTMAKPGLRIRLAGPPENLAGFGTVLRLRFGERLGPAREVRAGSGWWSQDSGVQVMSTPQTPTGIWLRWPGGKISNLDLPATTGEITISFDGKITLK